MRIGSKDFMTKNHTYVCGILNVTPDSFSDGGKWNDLDRALFHVDEMIKDGMELLDIGGESTRPGYTKLADEDEIDRVVPVIRAVKERFDIPVSLDTYKYAVAKAGIEAGADLINDIWGLKYDDRMADLIAQHKIPCCLMHNRDNTNYHNFMDDVIEDLKETIQIAKKACISENQIIIDPGVGFAKDYTQNLLCIKNLNLFQNLGYPVLLGTSRKSVIGLTLDLPATERVEGTLATTVMAVMSGCMFVRVHDVKENARIIKMTEAILNV